MASRVDLTVCEFVLLQTPVSQQARRRQRVREWTSTVAAAARQAHGADRPAHTQPAAVAITYYFVQTDIDLDNLAKPVLDGMKGVVLHDDQQIVELLIRKRTINAANQMVDLPELIVDALLSDQEFLHVAVGLLGHGGFA